MELFGEQEISIPSEEDEQFSDDSKSDEGEEVWEESDESCTEESWTSKWSKSDFYSRECYLVMVADISADISTMPAS